MSILRKKQMNKRGAISLALAGVCAFATCSLTACLGGKDFNADADMDAVNSAASTMLETPTDGTTPADYTAAENAFYAAYAMDALDGFVGYSEGDTVTKVAVANVSQKIKSYRVVNGEEAYKESVSHSTFKGVGTRRFVSGDNYIIHEASKVNNVNDVTWKDEAQKISKESYIEQFGYVPNGITAYIITEETILSAESLGEENGLYSFRYELDPVKATAPLLLEMRTMAGTKSLPLFERAAVVITMDETWKVTKTVTDCVYQVDMLGGVTCTEAVTEIFSNYNEGIEAPNAEFYRSYMNADVSETLPEDATALDYLMNGFSDYITGTKPLKVELGVSMAGETPLSVLGQAEIDINLDDLSKLGVKANIDEISFGEAKLNDLFIGYQNEVAYVSLGDFKAKGEVEEISAIVGKLLSYFGVDLSELGSSFSSIDTTSLLANATLEKGETQSVVTLPLNLGDLTINAELVFNEGENISLVGAKASIGDVLITLTPNDDLILPEIGTDYRILTPVFDVIDENGDVKLDVSLGDINALVNLHLADMSADVSLGDITAKYADETIYLNYKDLKLKLGINEIEPIVNKLMSILDGKIELPDLDSLAQTIDVTSLLTGAVNGLTLVEADDVLTISTSIDGISLAIKLNITNNGYTYSFGGIEVAMDGLDVAVTPTEESFNAIANDDLHNYNNIATLLDLIDENNEINLQATVDAFVIDLNVNLETLTVLAKTELYGNTLFLKYYEETIYVSYLDLNVSVNVNDFESVMNKLKPILGDSLDLSSFGEFDVQTLIDSIVVTDGEVLTVSAEIFGMKADILFNTTDGNLTIKEIKATIDELAISAVPAAKADYSAMPNATYYNLVSLLDLIDEDNNVSLFLYVDRTEIYATLNLEKMVLLVKLDDLEAHVDLNSGDVYVRYPGAKAKANFNDLGDILDVIKPILDKFVGEDALGGLDLDGMSSIDVKELLSTVAVKESNGKLTISLELSGVQIALDLSTENGDLSFTSAIVSIDETEISVTEAESALTFEFDLGEDYIDLKDLVNTFGETLSDVLTSDSVSVALGGSIVNGNTTYNLLVGEIKIDSLSTAPRANVNLTIEIVTTAEDGTVKTTTHELKLIYLDPSLVAAGETNAYVTYDNKLDTNIFEATFVTSKFDTTLEILKQIYVNMPELQSSLDPIIVPDENGQPVLPDTSVDVISMINFITYVSNTLTVNLNGSAFMESLPRDMVASLTCLDNTLYLDVPNLAMGDLTINLNLSVRTPNEGEITDSTFAYTASSNASNFSSINELMQALETTSRHRAFQINGSVDLKIGSYVFEADGDASPINIQAQLEVIDDKTYASIYMRRIHLEALLGLVKAWEDYDGWVWIYFDPETNLIYVHDVSRTEEKKWNWSKFGYDYSYPETHTYTKYTPEEFTSDLMGNILSVVHLSSTFEKMITDSTGEDKSNNPTIENTFLKYEYNGANTFSIDLNLEALTKDIHDLSLDIGHDADMNINLLYAQMSVVDIIDIVLDASLTTHEAGTLGTVSAIATEKANAQYKSPTA